MSDVTNLDASGKTPIDKAVNKLREAMARDHQAKIEAQVKKTMDAAKILQSEKSELSRLLEANESDLSTLKDLSNGLT